MKTYADQLICHTAFHGSQGACRSGLCLFSWDPVFISISTTLFFFHFLKKIIIILFLIVCRYLRCREYSPERSSSPASLESVIFSSVSSHFGTVVSVWDDIESLAYTMIFFLKGSLPWSASLGPADASPADIQRIARAKQATTPTDICQGLPEAVLTLLALARAADRSAGPTPGPDFAHLTALVKSIAGPEPLDFVYDWSKERRRSLDSPGVARRELELGKQAANRLEQQQRPPLHALVGEGGRARSVSTSHHAEGPVIVIDDDDRVRDGVRDGNFAASSIARAMPVEVAHEEKPRKRQKQAN